MNTETKTLQSLEIRNNVDKKELYINGEQVSLKDIVQIEITLDIDMCIIKTMKQEYLPYR